MTASGVPVQVAELGRNRSTTSARLVLMQSLDDHLGPDARRALTKQHVCKLP